jgi:hypothetical protein
LKSASPKLVQSAMAYPQIGIEGTHQTPCQVTQTMIEDTDHNR